MCSECFERLVSNILQGDKMPHFFYFVYILILIPITKGSIYYYWNENGLDGRIARPNCLQPTWDDKMAPNWTKLWFYIVDG